MALASYPFAGGPPHRAMLGTVGIVAVALVAAAVVSGHAAALPWALAALVAEYAGARGTAGGVDAGVPIYAAALFACAELGYWSCDLRRVGSIDGRAIAIRLATLASLTAVGALAAGAATAAASGAAPGAGVGQVAVGTACAVAVVMVLAWLASRAAGRQRPGSEAAAAAPPSSVPKTRR